MSRNLARYYDRQAARYERAAQAFRDLTHDQPDADEESRQVWTRSADYLDRLGKDYRKAAAALATLTIA